MSDDPNGTRWSNSENNYGKSLLKRAGWTEGNGLGRNQEGTTSHVKTKRKDDVMGIGYEGGVQETWSSQSVGFADVLARIQNSVVANSASDSDDGMNKDESSEEPKTKNGPSGGRYVGMYAKRHALKTELLRTKDNTRSEEILGSASSSRKHQRESGNGAGADNLQKSTLRSPLLERLMIRVPLHEPKPTTGDDEDMEMVRVTKPNPRPPKCTDTPFLAS